VRKTILAVIAVALILAGCGAPPEKTETRYTVSFDLNGGSGTAPAPQSVISGFGAYLPSGNGFSKVGHTFSGWNTSADGMGDHYNPYNNYTPSGDTTLYAVWTTNQYYVSFSANGGSGTAPAPQSVIYGSEITIPDDSGLSRVGYVFGGWNTAVNGSGTTYNAGDSYTATGNITLYAKWVARVTITFSINGGSGTPPAPQTVIYGSEITIPDGSELSRANYTFGGWNTAANGLGTTYNAGDLYTVNNSVSLYAKWIVSQYTVSFSANGGSGTPPASQTVSAGSGITLPDGNGLSRTYYAFGGWNTAANGTGTTYNAGEIYTPDGTTSSVTLYAKWDSGSTSKIEYYWVDQHSSLVTTSGGSALAGPGESLAITAQGDGYTVHRWDLNGINTGESGNTYIFSSTTMGKHTVGLIVEKDGRFYNTNINITVALYTVTFNINGGSGTTPSAQLVNAGSSITLPYLTRSGYDFLGWTISPLGTGTIYTDGSSYTPAGTITLFAKWGGGAGTEANPYVLSGSYTSGAISTTIRAVWYSFYAVGGETYYIWWRDSDNSSYTLDVKVAASYSSGALIFDVDNGPATSPIQCGQNFTASASGIVKIRVYPYTVNRTGTFAITYSTTNIRP